MANANSFKSIRILVGIMFLVVAISKIFYFSDYIALIPFGGLAVYAGVLVMIAEVFGGFSLLINRRLKIASVLLMGVLIGALIFVVVPDYFLQNNLFSLTNITQLFLHLILIFVLFNIYLRGDK